LQGGLGNQLFQIFTTIAYGLRQKSEVVFPYTPILTSGKERPTYWENFLVSLKWITTANPNYGLTNEQLSEIPNYMENGYPWQPFPQIDDTYNIRLYGYFQTAKYFDEYRDFLFKMICLEQQKRKIRDEYSKWLYIARGSNVHLISMHFRLGDYKEKQLFHPIIGIEYYERALAHILEQRTNTGMKYRVLYFCELEDNEIVWGHIEHLQSVHPMVEFVKVDDSVDDWKQLLIMSCCRDNIIPNSTFSWWGAYFNETADKIVCYPSLWFGPFIQEDLRDLHPAEWCKIDI
jgi:hypothetical protein